MTTESKEVEMGTAPEKEFPVLTRTRRALEPDHPLFAEGDAFREKTCYLLSPQSTCEVISSVTASHSEPVGATHRLECSVCGRNFPTHYILDMHIMEAHDSFFAAQAARKMKVYQCLVEGCPKKFSRVVYRNDHLHKKHKFSEGFGFETMHLKLRRQKIQTPKRKNSHKNDTIDQDEDQADQGRGSQEAKMDVDASATDRVECSNAENVDSITVITEKVSQLSFGEGQVPERLRFGRRQKGMIFQKQSPEKSKKESG